MVELAQEILPSADRDLKVDKAYGILRKMNLVFGLGLIAKQEAHVKEEGDPFGEVWGLVLGELFVLIYADKKVYIDFLVT